MFDETVDSFGEDALEITLTRSTSSVGSHHARDGSIGAKERSEFGRRFELGGEDRLDSLGSVFVYVARWGELTWNIVRSRCSSLDSYWFP